MLIKPADYLPHANLAEGNIPHMYLDTVGVVTVGIGHALATPAAAAALPFVLRATGQPAGAAQIGADYARVKTQPSALIASHYKAFGQTHLSETTIADLFAQDMNQFLPGLAAAIPGFADFPKTAQLALVDMAFNLGVRGLVSKFPKMMRFVSARDWTGCARECRRPQLNEGRNRQVAAWFHGAVETQG